MSGHEMVEKPIAMKKWELCQIPLQNSAGAGIYCTLNVSWVPPANSGTKPDDSCSISQVRSIREG